MDSAGILAASLAGAAGVLAGLAAAAIAIALFKPTQGATVLRTIFGAIGLSLSQVYLVPIIESGIGPHIRSASGATSQVGAEIRETIRDEPLFAALLEDHPELEDDFVRTVEEGFAVGGKPRATENAVLWGADQVGKLFVDYIDRARDEDILAWAEKSPDLIRRINAEAPATCYDLYYGVSYGHPPDLATLSSRLQIDINNLANNEMAAIIVNAGDDPVAYDVEAAQSALEEVGAVLVEEIGMGRVSMLSGMRPNDEGDARVICEATANMYENVLATDGMAASILRHTFSLVANK